MARRVFGTGDLSEALQDFLSGCAKLVMTLGGLATIVSVGLLVFTCFRVGETPTASQMADAVRNVDIFQKVLIVGVLGLSIGATYMFWGAELLGAGLVMGAAALYFAPLYLPSMVGDRSNEATQAAYGALQQGGTILGVIGLLVVLADLGLRIQMRMKSGAKVDQLKYGRGIKEEPDKQNVPLGKCWQLPFCRKFVRESCPIYLSRRTCWKELVGCMCEESVIRGAMENRTFSKDAILEASFIPKNHKLSDAQKKERCYSCVIFNHHQQQKYKIMMPGTALGLILIFLLLHSTLFDAMGGLVEKINHVVKIGTLGASGNYKPPEFFVESMLVVFLIIAIAYAAKVIEFICFKIKA